MFTPDGRVREEFAAPAESTPVGAEPEPSESVPSVAPRVEPATVSGPELPITPADAAAPLESPGQPAAPGAPSFYDLVDLMMGPISIYLGDLELPDGQAAEDLDMARFHIDLLDLLRQRTAGNLTAEEQGVVEDLLYRLRVRYVQKRG